MIIKLNYASLFLKTSVLIKICKSFWIFSGDKVYDCTREAWPMLLEKAMTPSCKSVDLFFGLHSKIETKFLLISVKY